MIRESEVFYIGRISKYRGIGGEVEILFTDDAFDRGSAEYLLFELEGILVPFFWEEYRFKNDDTVIFKFEGIDTDLRAKRFVGTRIYYPHCEMPEKEETELRSIKALTGYTIELSDGTALGHVDSVDDSSANILLYVSTPGGEEIIIPFHNDFLIDYSISDRRICLQLPDGLLDLNNA